MVIPEPIRETDSYLKLLSIMHGIKYSAYIPMDNNRIKDGLDLRDRFIDYLSHDEYAHLTAPAIFKNEECSVLEMMAALAIRCEETMMYNPQYGDRTSKWFWEMLVNLELDDMSDYNIDNGYVASVINRLITHSYDADGRGGLFYIPDCPHDMRREEVWTQLCWYMGTKE